MPSAPECPGCGQPLDAVLDLPYGYWSWVGTGYEWRSPSARVDVSPWTCAACLTELRAFHPQDFGTEAQPARGTAGP